MGINSGHLTTSINGSQEWSTSTAYRANDLVMSSGLLYRVKLSHTSSSAPASDTTNYEVANLSTSTLYYDPANSRIGIGTSSPLAKLHTKGAAAISFASFSNVIVEGTEAYNASPTQGISFQGVYNSANAVTITGGIYAGKENATDGNYASFLGFHTRANGGVPTERMRIDSSGNVGIGETPASFHLIYKSIASNYALQVANTNATTPYVLLLSTIGASSNDATRTFLDCGDSTTLRASIRSNGGIANFQANDVNLSDSRLKEDIIPLESSLAKINAIEVVKYKYKDQTHTDYNIGAIAQQIEAVAPELIDSDGFGVTPEDGIPYKAIYQTDLQYMLLKAIQELSAKNDALEARLAVLEGA